MDQSRSQNRDQSRPQNPFTRTTQRHAVTFLSTCKVSPLEVTVETPSCSTKFDVSQKTARKSCNLGCHDLFFHLWPGLFTMYPWLPHELSSHGRTREGWELPKSGHNCLLSPNAHGYSSSSWPTRPRASSAHQCVEKNN